MTDAARPGPAEDRRQQQLEQRRWRAQGWDPDWEPPPADEDFDEAMAAAMAAQEPDMATWIAGLPPDIRELWLEPEFTAEGEALAAGFLHHEPGLNGVGFAAGGTWDRLPPGPLLAQIVEAQAAPGHDGLGESELIGVLCAWSRMAAWAQAGQAAAVAALQARRFAQARERELPHLAEHVPDELAAALMLTSRSAEALADQAAGLARFPAVHAALRDGQLDWRRAVIFAVELAGVTDHEAARQLADQVLSAASQQTTAQLRRALRRAVVCYDPEAALRRKEAARADAEVDIFPEASGNAAIAGRELPAADVLAADRRLTALAKWLRERGAAGNVQQLRAAAFLALLTGKAIADLIPEPGTGAPPVDADSPLAAEAGPAISGSVNLTMPLSSLAGLSDRAGDVAGHGPVDASTCRDLAGRMGAAAATRWCLTVVSDDGSAVLAHVCASRGSHGPGPPPAGAGALAWATTLAAGLEWLDRGSCSHQMEEPQYRPSDRLAHLIRIRQPRCDFPGCSRAAAACDLDHTRAYDAGGRTCWCNLAPLSRGHHRCKQAPGWHLEQPEPGVLRWTAPSGRTYRTAAEPMPL
jgi:hypothetical protein